MRLLISATLLLLSPLTFANVETLIIDTGSGHASVTRFPNGDIMVYDTGHWRIEGAIAEKFSEFIGDADIDLLIVSHTDSDHLGATDVLLNSFRVHRVIRPGITRDTNAWREHDQAINSASNSGVTHEINLSTTELPHGTQYNFGGATVTYLSGFSEPPPSGGLTGSEFLNGGSIVVRVTYNGHSILFTGDAVGRHESNDDQDAPAIATERFLIDHRNSRPIQSDVLIAPHHGSNDASSKEFISAVAPRWVVFPAGSHNTYNHPRAVTAQRYLDLGLSPECLMRTDLGDDEGGQEWSFGSVSGHDDPYGDDAVSIILQTSGDPVVRYVGKGVQECPQVIATSTAPPVSTNVIKKSRSGICHTPESSWYARTKNFVEFADLTSCLESGGRLLK